MTFLARSDGGIWILDQIGGAGWCLANVEMIRLATAAGLGVCGPAIAIRNTKQALTCGCHVQRDAGEVRLKVILFNKLIQTKSVEFDEWRISVVISIML